MLRQIRVVTQIWARVGVRGAGEMLLYHSPGLIRRENGAADVESAPGGGGKVGSVFDVDSEGSLPLDV